MKKILIFSVLLLSACQAQTRLSTPVNILPPANASAGGQLRFDDSTSVQYIGLIAPTTIPTIAISSATTANPMVLTFASAPTVSVNSIIVISGALGTGCSVMNGPQVVTAVTGPSVTIGLDGTGCTYTGSSAVGSTGYWRLPSADAAGCWSSNGASLLAVLGCITLPMTTDLTVSGTHNIGSVSNSWNFGYISFPVVQDITFEQPGAATVWVNFVGGVTSGGGLGNLAFVNTVSQHVLDLIDTGGFISYGEGIPAIDNSYVLGTSALRWSDIRTVTETISTSLNVANVSIGGGGTSGSGISSGSINDGCAGWLSHILVSGVNCVSLSANNTWTGRQTYQQSGSNTGIATILVEQQGSSTDALQCWQNSGVTSQTCFDDLGDLFPNTGSPTIGTAGASFTGGYFNTAFVSNVNWIGSGIWANRATVPTSGTYASDLEFFNNASSGLFAIVNTGGAISLGPFLPDVDNTRTLGNSSFRWSDIRGVNETLTGTMTAGGYVFSGVGNGCLGVVSTIIGVGVNCSAAPGSWTLYSPTIGNMSGVSSTYYYSQFGKDVMYSMQVTGTVVANAPVTFSIPVTAFNTAQGFVGTIYLNSCAAANFISVSNLILTSTTTLSTEANASSGSTYCYQFNGVYQSN